MAQITTKSGPFKVENNAQTLPKQLQNNFEKIQKMTFSTTKMVKNDTSNQPKWPKIWHKISIKMVKNDPSLLSNWAKFWPKISIIGVIDRHLGLIIPQKGRPFWLRVLNSSFCLSSVFFFSQSQFQSICLFTICVPKRYPPPL